MYWIGIILILGARLLWQRRPNLGTSSLFWAVAILFIVVTGWTNAPSQYFLAIGIFANAAVTLANGGYMPVAAHRRGAVSGRSVWVERESSQRLLFLADNFGNRFIRFSVGDAFLLAGFVLSFFGA
jgi:hypothetical protein